MRMRLGGCLLAGLFVVVSGSWAGTVPITIGNYSFESPTCTASVPSCGAPTSWTASASGVNAYLPPTGAWDVPVPNGSQIAAINNGYLSQVLAADVLADTTYTLSVWVSERSNPSNSFQPTIELLGGSTVLMTMNTSNSGGALPTRNSDGTYTWVDWTMSFTTPDSAAYIGQPLEIYLGSPGPQADFDAVSLDQSVPEPAMFMFVGTGLLGLLARRRYAK